MKSSPHFKSPRLLTLESWSLILVFCLQDFSYYKNLPLLAIARTKTFKENTYYSHVCTRKTDNDAPE